MKNFIQLFALLVLFTSCSIENDNLDVIQEHRNEITENSFKTVTITYDSNIDLLAIEELKTELNVRKIIQIEGNSVIWVMYNKEEVNYIEEFVVFIDGVVGVEIVDGDTTSEEERSGDTTGNGDTDSEEERSGDTTGNGDTDSEEE